VVEGGDLLCYYIHTVSLSILRCSKLRPLLGSPPYTQMAAETEHDVVTGEQGSPVAGDSTKRRKPKGAHHAFDWEALEDPNMRAEKGWEDEKDEYWSSKMCKKYVKMCHIDKLWPKECHVAHTKGFACRPYTCKDDHFIHRAEEVWRALFGNRERNKVLLNYGLVAMVYAELKLERKVDWSTYPTRTQFPLCIGKTTKDIPDIYTPESAATKGILTFLRKKLEWTTGQGSSSKKGAKQKATHVHETSNHVLREQDPRVQNPPASGAIPTVVQGSTIIVEKPKLEVGTESPIAVVDAVIEKLTGVNPSPPTTPTTLPNPVHTTDAVATDAINIQPRVEVAHNMEYNVGHDDTVPKPAGTLQDRGPSVAAPSIPHSLIGVPPDYVGVGLDVMEMLRNMPNSEKLKELLELNTMFAQICRESGE
jgi:hypothetical protein